MVSRVYAQGIPGPSPITLIGILLLGLPILTSCQSVAGSSAARSTN